jgi:hypothetical protein
MYNNLLEQQFQLKHYGNLDVFEQNSMTAEDRKWYMKRLEKEFKERSDKERQSMPRMPRTPSVRKR